MEWNHFDENGNAVMVDVSGKEITERIAVASGKIRVNDAVMTAIVTHTAKKGDVLTVARVAGIMGTKQTSNLIPMCHPLGQSFREDRSGDGGTDGRECGASDDL